MLGGKLRKLPRYVLSLYHLTRLPSNSTGPGTGLEGWRDDGIGEEKGREKVEVMDDN